MDIKELKTILKEIPADAEILLSVDGHDKFTDDCSTGPSQAYSLTIGGEPVFYLTSGALEHKPEELNYGKVETVKHWDRAKATLKHDGSGEPLYDDDYFKEVWDRIESTFPKYCGVV